MQRAMDYSVKWRRAIILSGVGTIVKLTTAADHAGYHDAP